LRKADLADAGGTQTPQDRLHVLLHVLTLRDRAAAAGSPHPVLLGKERNARNIHIDGKQERPDIIMQIPSQIGALLLLKWS